MSSPHPSIPQSLSPSPQVSFIIPLYNCLPLTQAMLASLQSTLPAGLTHEIIFVDDGSSDRTREWLQATLREPPFRVVLNERNLGYAVSNNRGAAVARGHFLALLNNDLVLQSEWLERMLAAHAKFRGRAGVIGNVQLDAKTNTLDHAGLVVNITGKPVHACALPPSISRFLRPVRRVPAVTGACMLIERALWEQLGGFDEGFVNGGEDIDLCFRAHAAGRINAVALRSVVRHHVSSSPGRKTRDEQNSYRLARKWRGQLVDAADEGKRSWCREYLAGALVIPRSAEFRLAIAACAYLAHLRRPAPPEAVAAVSAGLEGEFARWQNMFGR
jgi:O-antigen biosynthesis protein